MSDHPSIEVVKASTHNLKAIDCRIPHRRLTVVTGPSGAGKSSLAFDTVFAEGQRRFVESMSTYARQFIGQMERPPVEEVRNVLPAVALEARNSVRNARSTVGTISESLDALRLLFAHLGEVRCGEDGEIARSFTPQEIVAELEAGRAGERFLLVAPVERPRRRANDALKNLVQQGFARRLDEEGEIQRMTSSSRWPVKLDPLPLVLGRFRAGSASARLAEAVEDALALGHGRLEARPAEGSTVHFSRGFGCMRCGSAFHRPQPALFSFNSPLGACSECQGFGRVIGIDRGRVIPDESLCLADQPIAPWNSPAYEDRYERLFDACRERRVPLDMPWRELPAVVREWIWAGDGPFTSIEKFFAWLEHRSYKVHVRVLLARYRAYDPCPSCAGSRLKPEALAVRWNGRTLPELCAMSIEDLRAWLARQTWTPRQLEIAEHLIDELGERVEVLYRVGLDYLTLDRQARTLSGGEAQRIQLAAALGSGLTSTLYVLDEPTIGLHPRDSHRLLELLRDLSVRGNTVLVVEHDRTLIEGADHVIDLGPLAGEHGGRVMAEGPLATVLEEPESLTAVYLQERPPTAARQHLARYRRERGQEPAARDLTTKPRFEVRGARSHNLESIDVDFPAEALVAVTGVSGSGKSTLVENVIYANYQRRRGVVDVEPGECDGLAGFDEISDVVLVDQRPLGRSSRSNPVTYVKAYDEIRKLYAAQPLAQKRGITPGHFSFNTDKGRCPRCKGSGEVEIDMQFMSAVSVVCDECHGRRFRPEVLRVRYAGLTIAETLELTIEQALERFADRKGLVRRLRFLADAGLAYLRLGQPTATLSGGEAQRLKLASFLAERRRERPRLLLFDEPTTGLHMADIDLLHHTLRRLVDAGHSVVVVEHSPDLVARADWIVDLGPGGGVRGGRLLYSGPIEGMLEGVESPTADELRRHLKWEPRQEVEVVDAAGDVAEAAEVHG